MHIEDFETVAELSRALWADSTASDQNAADAVVAVAGLKLDFDQRAEKVGTSIYYKAARDGRAAIVQGISQPFYRLSVDERFVLSALHVGKWSYGRVARVLARTPEAIEEIAWSARLELSSIFKGALHPTGTLHRGAQCPEYNLRRPWTQRFLDSELPAQERAYLQDHMQHCDDCRSALGRARKLYYSVVEVIPRATDSALRARRLKQISRRAELIKTPLEASLSDSLRIFISRPANQLWFFSFCAVWVFIIRHYRGG